MSDPDTTKALIRKTIAISPSTRLHVQLGTLYGAAGVLISAAIFVYAIKSKVDQTYDAVVSIQEDIKPTIEHTAILWDEHARTALNRGKYGAP